MRLIRITYMAIKVGSLETSALGGNQSQLISVKPRNIELLKIFQIFL